MARVKQTVIEKSRKEYLKKVMQLREILEGTEQSKVLDYENTKLNLLNEIGIDANITIPFIKELKDGEFEALEEFIYHTSAEHKLKLYTVDVFNDEIILKTPSIEKLLTKDLTSKLVREHFLGEKIELKESIYLYEKNCSTCIYNKLSHIHPDCGQIRVCELINAELTKKIIGMGEDINSIEYYDFRTKNCYNYLDRRLSGDKIGESELVAN